MADFENQGSPDGSTSPAIAKKTNTAEKSSEDPKKIKHSKPNHPSIAFMVNSAIAALNDRHGFSLQAIKKYISTNYPVDMKKTERHIKKYVKTAVDSELIIKTKGTGLSGSFKLPPLKPSKKRPKPTKETSDEKSAAKVKVKVLKVQVKPTEQNAKPPAKRAEPPVEKSPKKEKATKPRVAKKSSQEIVEKPIEKKMPTKKGRAAGKLNVEEEKPPKSPSKAKKARSPVAKPKTPKPKRLTGKKTTTKAA